MQCLACREDISFVPSTAGGGHYTPLSHCYRRDDAVALGSSTESQRSPSVDRSPDNRRHVTVVIR